MSVTEELIKNSERRHRIKPDNVNHPKHYADTTSIECIEAMLIAFGREAVICFCKCNAFKYLWRYKNKNGGEDLEKATWYCYKAASLLLGDEQDSQISSLVQVLEQHKAYVNVKNTEIGEG